MKVASYSKDVGNSAVVLKILGAKTKLHARFSTRISLDTPPTPQVIINTVM